MACGSKWLLTLALLTGAAAGTHARPNVLVVVLDDLNTWIEPIGEYPDVRTPAMNRLAQGGVTFTRAQCQAPICAPSRVSFLSGLRPSTTGLYSLNSTLYNHPAYGTGKHKTLHQFFKEAGYVTATAGKVFHTEAELNAIGAFLNHRGPGADYGPTRSPKFTDTAVSGSNALVDWGAYPPTDAQTPDYQTVTWATNRLAECATNPASAFFMTVGIVRPHMPLYAPPPYYELYSPGSFALPFYQPDDLADTPRFARYLHWVLPEPCTETLIAYNEWTNHTRAYLAAVTFADAMVGRLLDGLANHNLTSNTVVVLVGDNGYHLGEKGLTAKTTLWDRATRVPLIVSAPGMASGQKCVQPVDLLDVYPTLLDLCNLPAYAPLEGLSLRPQLANPTNPPARRPALTTHGPNNHAVVDARFRYIRYADGTEEFYDRYVDADERVNRIGHPNLREAARALAAFLPATNAANVSGTSRIAEIGPDKIIRWEGSPIYDSEAPGFIGGRLDGSAWIWWRSATNAAGGETSLFRRTFVVENPGAVVSAVLTATADNVVEVWINGTRLFANSAWRELTITNIAQYLQAGANVLAVKATNNPGAASPAGFLGSLEITLTNGPGEYIVTANSVWKSVNSASSTGWATNGFSDSAWGTPAIIASYDTGPWAGQTGGGTPARRDTNALPVTAESAADDDADQLPDWWEGYYTGYTNVLLGRTADYDNDLATDVREYRMGTNPTNPAAVLSLAIEPAAGGGFTLSHFAEPGRDYRLATSENLTTWSPFGHWLYGEGQVAEHLVPVAINNTAGAYYRVEVRPASPGQ
jgi:arylsulfatase A-like enzyme